MSKAVVMLVLLICSLLFSSCVSSPAETSSLETMATVAQDSIPPVVVVELFTSQGCSSCPPADELLGELLEEENETEPRLIALSFHVDYWNRLGWKDPYSQEAFSNRQYEYSGKLPGGRVYTPQIVIGGQEDVVGSRKSEVRTQLRERATNTGNTIALNLELQKQDEDGWTVDFQASGELTTQPQLLNVALVQREAINEVSRGENRGRQLRHFNVVLDFQQYSLTEDNDNGRLTFKHPGTAADFALIVYVQDNDSWAILGAAELDLPVRQYLD